MPQPATEIIVYRNPMEKAFYDNNGPAFVLVFVVAFFVVFAGGIKILKSVFKMNDYSINFGVMWLIGILATVAACIACWWLVL